MTTQTERISSDPEILRQEIESRLIFRHVEDRPADYRGSDRVLVQDYSATLDGCWLRISVLRPDPAFCRVASNRTREQVVENDLAFVDRVEVRPVRGDELLAFWPGRSVASASGRSDQPVSREVWTDCSGRSRSEEDRQFFAHIILPQGAADGLPPLLLAYRRAVCPNLRDRLNIFGP